MSHDCPHCDRSLPNSNALEDHVSRAHPDAKEPTNWTPILVGVLAVLALGAVGAALITGGGGSAENPYHIESSPHTGDLDAPVQFIAFESPACTSCRLFHIPREGNPSTFDQVIENYVDTGKILYVDKFARAGYGWDRVGGNAQKCAWHLGGWEAFEGLTQSYYENRRSISGSNAASFALDWARQSPTVDAGQFRSCFEDRAHDGDITTDLADGQQAGVAGTPTFIIVSPDGDTRKIVGPQPYSTFANAIEGALADVPRGDAGDGDTDDGTSNSTNGSNGTTQARGTRNG